MRNSRAHTSVQSVPVLRIADPPRPKSRQWRVIHACEYARDVLPILEGQITAGMRPFIVTPMGAGTAEAYLARKDLEQPDALSLLRAWQDVRNWRKSLLECDPENKADLVHTHSFSSGMAGVRNLSCVVYDFKACIEELAMSAGQCERGSWMARSFRVAEQFILSRAKAVIVHSQGMKSAAHERGAAPENVFLIPAPVALDELPLMPTNFLREHFAIDNSSTIFYLPQSLPAQGSSAALGCALEAFALAVAANPELRLLIEAAPEQFPGIRGHAERLGISKHIVCVEEKEASAVLQGVDVVISTGETPDDPVHARYPNPACLQALSAGKPLLAADVEHNRGASPEGRGCLWFRENDAHDLASRVTFLAGNPGFRAALANAGRALIVETRSSTVIGHEYDAAYRHALAQKRANGLGPGATTLLPITSTT